MDGAGLGSSCLMLVVRRSNVQSTRRVFVDRREFPCSPWVVFPVTMKMSPLKPLWLDLMSPVLILMGALSCASMLSDDVSMKIGPVTRRDAPPRSLTAPPTPSPFIGFVDVQSVSAVVSPWRFQRANSLTCVGTAL